MVSVVHSFVKLLAVALFVSVFAAGPALAKGPAKGGAVLAALRRMQLKRNLWRNLPFAIA